MTTEKIGRNDPCLCGSGKKYKNCCMQKEQQKRASMTPTGKRKFTAKVLSGGGAAKAQPVEQTQEKQKPAVDYTSLMERSFGSAIHTDEKPPLPANSEQYLVKENGNGEK